MNTCQAVPKQGDGDEGVRCGKTADQSFAGPPWLCSEHAAELKAWLRSLPGNMLLGEDD